MQTYSNGIHFELLVILIEMHILFYFQAGGDF